MKKTLLFVSGLLITAFAQAQSPTLTSAINPSIGDKQVTLTADSVGIYEGSAGINKTWDYSKLVQDSAQDSAFIKYVDPKATPYASDFPNATISGEDTTTGPDYEFYNMNNAGESLLGEAEYDSTTASATIIAFSSPLVEFTFPVRYGYSNSSKYSGSTSSNGATIYLNGNQTVNADAYGTLKIRNTQYDSVLRIVTVNMGVDSIDFGIGSLIIYDTLTTYAYYTPGKKSPILSIDYDAETTDPSQPSTVTKAVTFNDFDHDHTAGIMPVAGKIEFGVFPNPAIGSAQISLSATHAMEANISVTNAIGQTVKTMPNVALTAGANNLDLDLQGLGEGVYFVNMVSGSQTGVQQLVISR